MSSNDRLLLTIALWVHRVVSIDAESLYNILELIVDVSLVIPDKNYFRNFAISWVWWLLVVRQKCAAHCVVVEATTPSRVHIVKNQFRASRRILLVDVLVVHQGAWSLGHARVIAAIYILELIYLLRVRSKVTKMRIDLRNGVTSVFTLWFKDLVSSVVAYESEHVRV